MKVCTSQFLLYGSEFDVWKGGGGYLIEELSKVDAGGESPEFWSGCRQYNIAGLCGGGLHANPAILSHALGQTFCRIFAPIFFWCSL